MRAVIQRVLSASVVVEGHEVSRIGKGLMCLIGISARKAELASLQRNVDTESCGVYHLMLLCLHSLHAIEDTPSDMDYITKKILSLRLFPDQVEDETLCKQWAKSVMEVQGEVLCVSQFTLHAATRKGSKPDFHAAMGSEQSKQFYASFLDSMGEQYRPDRIKDGEFGATMQVALTNEGPVTIIVDSHDTRSDRTSGSGSGSGNGSASGASTPEVGAQRAAQLEAKQRKREENERRQRENAAKRASRNGCVDETQQQ